MLTGIIYRFNQAQLRLSYALNGAGSYVRLRNQTNGRKASVASVMVGRNDDYMPDFANRLRATIGWNVRHFVDEAIFIEWNPPADRELLGTSLVKEFPQLKVYVVPENLHRMVCHNPRLPLMEYHAKNVGIRRATSPWIIATNSDVAFGADSILAFKKAELNHDIAWTAQRIDIPWKEWRSEHIGLKDCIQFRRIIPYSQHGTGDFLMASRELWHRVRGYDEKLLKHRIGCDIRGAAQLLVHGAQIQRIGNILHLAHPTSCTEQLQPHHGERAPLDNLPYQNDSDWGLGNCREIKISERIWQLE
jgi:hypothetical protein